MYERVEEGLRGEEAWIVGGAIRDGLLGRPIVDLDVACREPEAAARAFARGSGGAPFPLSERWGAWRVAALDRRRFSRSAWRPWRSRTEFSTHTVARITIRWLALAGVAFADSQAFTARALEGVRSATAPIETSAASRRRCGQCWRI